MDPILTSIVFIAVAAVILFTAFPHLLSAPGPEKKEHVGPVYWGVYEGQSTEDPEALKKIEIKKSKRKDKVVAGSAMYAKGRGTSFRM